MTLPDQPTQNGDQDSGMSPPKFLLASPKEFQPSQLLPSLFAGLIVSQMALVSSISNAALIFSGRLSGHLPAGISSALLSAALISLVVALSSSLRFAIAGPDANASAILALMAVAISSSPLGLNSAEKVLPTIWAAIALSTIGVSIFLFALGQLRVSRWIRLIPRPVIGGFLAGTGWVLVRSSFTVMADAPLKFEHLPRLLQLSSFMRWLPGLAFALALLILLRRFRHFLVMPGLLISAIVLYHLVLCLTGHSLSESIEQGWLLTPLSNQSLPHWNLSTLAQVDWPLLARQAPHLVSLMLVTAMSTLLNATGIEIATRQHADLDRELRSAGLANLVSGGNGGMVGFQSISRTLLAYHAGANSRLTGIFTALSCGGVLFLGSPILRYLPKPILGGLLLYSGLDLLIDWTYGAWSRLPRLESAQVIVILLMIALSGFITGVGLGLVIASVLFVINCSRIGDMKRGLFDAIPRLSNSGQFRFLRRIQLLKVGTVGAEFSGLRPSSAP